MTDRPNPMATSGSATHGPAEHGGPFQISLRRIHDVGALETLWRAAEAMLAGSFFQSWTWVGCLAPERFPTPVLLQAECDGQVAALGLLNRQSTRWGQQTLWLGQTGAADWDSLFVEHNNVLAVPGPVTQACVAALLRAAVDDTSPGGTPERRVGGRRVVLGGVDDATEAAVQSLEGVAVHGQTRLAPFVALDTLPPGQSIAARLSRSTRAQLRRAERLYGAMEAPRLTRAATVAEALVFLDRLAALHQARWRARGAPGAFASDAFRRFHHALVQTGLPRGEIDLLRIAAGDRDIGYLYNFRWRGRVHAYQSGFDYTGGPHIKPGLLCHRMAIDHYRDQGMATYDFLAGDDRYKLSFATGMTRLHWLEVAPARSLTGAIVRLRRWRQRATAKPVVRSEVLADDRRIS